ncbi:ecotin family protein, partial [Devosia sp. MC1541]|uniref:ecotin family protein n=1 Tax=Devosia sp. MC1541 TaxID=2725264 RepID=UPI0024A64CAA
PWPIWPTTSTASSSTKSAQPRHESARMTGKRRQWAPPIAKRRAKSAQTRKSDDHNRSRRLSEPVLAGLQLPVVVYTPEDVELRFRVWRADAEQIVK